MKRTLRVLQICCALAVASIFTSTDVLAQWDQASPTTNTILTRNQNVTVGNSPTRSSSNTRMQVNGGTNTYANAKGIRADVAANAPGANVGTAYGILGSASAFNANGGFYGARGTAEVSDIRTTISTKVSSAEGGLFNLILDDPVNTSFANTGSYLLAGARAQLSGTITTYPGTGYVTAFAARDLIKGTNTWAGYFEGRGYFEDRVGIGTTAPITDLDVRGTSIFISPSTAALPSQFAAMGESFGDCDIFGFTARENTNTFINVGIRDGAQPTISFNGTDGELDIVCDEDTSGCGTKVATFYCPGQMAIDVNGGGLFAGGTYVPADRSIMNSMEEVSDAMDRLQNLRAVSFDYSQDSKDYLLPSEKQIGFVADEISKVMPSAVSTTTNGLQAVNMDAVVPFLVEGVKELDNRNAADQLVNDEQSIRIAELERELAELKALVSQLAGGEVSQKGAQGSIDMNAEMPRLDQNAPNPFDQVTRIDYFVPSNARTASVQIVNLAGQVQATFDANIGNGQLEIPVGTMTEGVYFYSLIIDGAKVATRRMVVTK